MEGANLVLQSGAEVWMVPNTVYRTMQIGFAEIQKRISPCGMIGKYLFESLIRFYSLEEACWSAPESWSLGDSPAVGLALDPNCGKFAYRHAPIIKADTTYEYTDTTPMIRVYENINSRFVLEDFICKLQVLYGDD